MAGATPQLIKELREMTGAGMLDCKNALNETGGDLEKAVQALREASCTSKQHTHVKEIKFRSAFQESST